jgi:hypothetical protein
MWQPYQKRLPFQLTMYIEQRQKNRETLLETNGIKMSKKIAPNKFYSGKRQESRVTRLGDFFPNKMFLITGNLMKLT